MRDWIGEAFEAAKSGEGAPEPMETVAELWGEVDMDEGGEDPYAF